MLDAKDYKPGCAIYSFVAEDGTNTHVDSELLRQWCAANKDKLEIMLTPVGGKIAQSFLTDGVIDIKHVERVLQMPHLDPIIYGKTGTFTEAGAPDVLLIDGHHRFFAAWLSRCELLPSYILEPAQWQQFQIEGLPDLTEEQLRAMPTKPRRG